MEGRFAVGTDKRDKAQGGAKIFGTYCGLPRSQLFDDTTGPQIESILKHTVPEVAGGNETQLRAGQKPTFHGDGEVKD